MSGRVKVHANYYEIEETCDSAYAILNSPSIQWYCYNNGLAYEMGMNMSSLLVWKRRVTECEIQTNDTQNIDPCPIE